MISLIGNNPRKFSFNRHSLKDIFLLLCIWYSSSAAALLPVPVHSRAEICNLTQSILYDHEYQYSFEGTFSPIENNPTNLKKYRPFTTCLIHAQYGFFNSSESNQTIDLRETQVLSSPEMRSACLFGCNRVMFSIIETQSSTPIRVLLVTSRENTVCSENQARAYQTDEYFKCARRSSNSPGDISTGDFQYRESELRHMESKLPSTVFKQVGSQPLRPAITKCVPTEYSETIVNSIKNNVTGANGTFNATYPKNICCMIFNDLLNRYNEISSGVDRSKSIEPVSQLVGSGIPPAVNCLLPPDRSVPIQQEITAENEYQCTFGCIYRTYLHYATRTPVQFIFPGACVLNMFMPCYVACAPTNTPSRLPIPAILQVTDPSNDRDAVLRRAVDMLKAEQGFSQFTEDNIVETRTVVQGNNTYKVIIWFEQSIIEF